MVGTLDPIDVLVSDYAIHNYGTYLGSNQYQLQSGALIIRQPAPMSITGKYAVNIQIKSISGFDGAGTKLVAISLGTTSGNTRSIGNPLYFTSDGETLTIQGNYSIPVESWYSDYTYLQITVMNNTNDNPEVIEIYDGTITISDPVFSQTIQYSDGRIEIINVPKAFSIGDVVAVTHRRDGGVVVQRVTPRVVDIYPGEIEISIGTVPLELL